MHQACKGLVAITMHLTYLQHDLCINPLYSGIPYTSNFANSEDPDEMQHNAAFYQGLHCW